MILKNIKHITRHNHSYTQRKQNISINTHAYTNQHLTCISSFINGKHNCRHKLGKNTYFIENLSCNQLRCCNVPPNHRPLFSSISQQHTTPELGMILTRNKGTLADSHIAKDLSKFSQANTVGFIRLQRRLKG